MFGATCGQCSVLACKGRALRPACTSRERKEQGPATSPVRPALPARTPGPVELDPPLWVCMRPCRQRQTAYTAASCVVLGAGFAVCDVIT